MITEIYIEDNRLDLSKDLSSEFTYSIDDIQDFASRNTNFSKTIILPGNAINNKLFGHIFEFTSSNFYNPTSDNVGYNFNAGKSASCVIYVDKIQVFKGIIRLLEITIDRGSIEYECVVFGELGGFVTALNNDKLEDLDFSQYDHLWTRRNITDSWEQASGTTASGMGYYYPLIDYGQVSSNSKKDWSYKAFRPALFVKEYLDKIITGAGYTYEAPFFESNIFKRLVIPNNQKQLSNYSDIAFYGVFYPLNNTFPASPTPRPSLNMIAIRTLGYFTTNLQQSIFTYTGGQNINVRFEFTAVGTASDKSYILIKKNGTQVLSFTLEEGAFNYQKQSTTYISLTTNDTIEFVLDWDDYLTTPLTISTTDFEVKFISSSAQSVPLTYAEKIFINNTLPRGIYQRDFVASIVKMFNLYIVEDTTKDKHLKIIPFIDYYTTTANFLQVNDLEEELLVDNVDLLLLDDYSASHLDWSSKVDRSKPFKLKPMSELNGRFFEFKYKSDSDYYNEDYLKHYAQGYADHIEDTGFEFAKDIQTNEVIFSATPLVSYSGEDKIIPTIFKLSNTQNTQSEDPIDHNIRIMQIRKITSVSNWHMKDENGNIGSHLNEYPYAGHLDNPTIPTADINFGVPTEIYYTLNNPYPTANIFNAFWSDYVAEITDKDSKLLTCNVYLKITDIYGLDFSKLIYIDGALWRLNRVIDYNPTNPESTKCEFLRVIELTYA